MEGTPGIPGDGGTAESLLRLLYAEHALGTKGGIRDRLKRITDLEDEMDRDREMTFKLMTDKDARWELAAA